MKKVNKVKNLKPRVMGKKELAYKVSLRLAQGYLLQAKPGSSAERVLILLAKDLQSFVRQEQR